MTIVLSENDTNWPRADKNGRQELEIKMGKTHISFSVKNRHILTYEICN